MDKTNRPLTLVVLSLDISRSPPPLFLVAAVTSAVALSLCCMTLSANDLRCAYGHETLVSWAS